MNLKALWAWGFGVLTVLIIFVDSSSVKAQVNGNEVGTINTINTAVPFLRIVPDARAGGMGDVGFGLSPDANAMFFNCA